MIPWIIAMDLRILAWMNAGRSRLLDLFFASVTWAGSLFVLSPLAGVACVVFWRHGKKKDALLMAVGLAGASLLVHTMKMVFGRSRPDIYAPLVAMPGDGSFPSAHTAQITAFCLCLILAAWRGFPAGAAWAAFAAGLGLCFAVGVSRIYLQVHYASDVLVGGGVAVVWVIAVDLALRWVDARPFH